MVSYWRAAQIEKREFADACRGSGQPGNEAVAADPASMQLSLILPDRSPAMKRLRKSILWIGLAGLLAGGGRHGPGRAGARRVLADVRKPVVSDFLTAKNERRSHVA